MKLLRCSVIAAVVLCVPVAIGGQSYVDLGDIGGAHAKSDKSSSKGNSGSKSNNRGSGKSKSKSEKSREKSAKSEGGSKGANPFKRIGGSKTAKQGSEKGPKAVWTDLKNKLKPKSKKATTRTVASKPVRSKPVKKAAAAGIVAAAAHPSDLKSLNSLNRNVNGMVNSNDPKMEPFREFIEASLHSEETVEAYDKARKLHGISQVEFDRVAAEMGLNPDPDLAMEDLAARKKELLANEPTSDNPDDPAFREAYANWEKDLGEVDYAQDTIDLLNKDAEALETATTNAEEAQEAISEEALRQAIADSMNSTGQKNVAPEDISPEVGDWVADKLGVGEADGFIDQWPTDSAEETEGDDVSSLTEDPANPEGSEEKVIVTAASE